MVARMGLADKRVSLTHKYTIHSMQTVAIIGPAERVEIF